MRSFPQAYASTPAGDGPTSLNPGAAGVPGQQAGTSYKVTPGARTTPLGSALYLPPIKAMADRTLPPEYWTGGPSPT